MSLLDQALALAARGFYVFPLRPGAKLPAIRKWPVKATITPDIIRLWWNRNPDYNIGIATGPSKLLVVDVDVKNDKRGDQSILKLELEGFEFPLTARQNTPTGGWHLLYSVDEPVKGGVNVFGPGLDVRSAGGFVVGGGSVLGSGVYSSDTAPIAPAPAWMVERCGRATPKPEPGPAPLGIDPKRAVARARHYLEHEAPVSTEGDGGDDTAYKVACRLKDFGLDVAEAVAQMWETWNPRCAPPWQFGDIQAKVENAYRYGVEPVGAAAPEAQFQPVQEKAETVNGGEHPFEVLNFEYAFVIAGNSHHILHETTDVDGRFELKHLAEGSFHKKHAAETLALGDGKTKPLTELWMRDARRRSFDALVFKPGLDVDKRFYNLWRGFAYEPLADDETPSAVAAAAVEAWKEHALKNICRGHAELYRWLVGYFAHLVQKPWQKPLVALVFKGGKGTGKNALIDCVGKLFGPHYLVTSNRRYLVGNFNGHLENCVLLAFDEAFWSGDKQAEGILKDLITGNKHVIEHKGQEPYTVDNCTRVAIIGNEDWVVPASHDERRFAIFDVGDGRKQDRAFFESMRKGMESGGYRLLLRFLLGVDISGLDTNDAPRTEGLLEQKLHSLDRFEKWWFECLAEGRILQAEFMEGWPEVIGKEQFRQAFKTYVRHNMPRGTWMPDDRSIGHKLSAMCPGVTGTSKVKGAYVYTLPPLDVARAGFDKFIGHKVGWKE